MMGIRSIIRTLFVRETEPEPLTPKEMKLRAAEMAVTLYETETDKFDGIYPWRHRDLPITLEWGNVKIHGVEIQLGPGHFDRLQAVKQRGEDAKMMASVTRLAEAIVARGATEQNNS